MPLLLPVVMVFVLSYGTLIFDDNVSESTILKSEIILDSLPNNEKIVFINKLLLKESKSVNSRFYQTELSNLELTNFYDNNLLLKGWEVASTLSSVPFFDQEIVRRYYHAEMKFYLSIYRTELSKRKAIILIISLE